MEISFFLSLTSKVSFISYSLWRLYSSHVTCRSCIAVISTHACWTWACRGRTPGSKYSAPAAPGSAAWVPGRRNARRRARWHQPAWVEQQPNQENVTHTEKRVHSAECAKQASRRTFSTPGTWIAWMPAKPCVSRLHERPVCQSIERAACITRCRGRGFPPLFSTKNKEHWGLRVTSPGMWRRGSSRWWSTRSQAFQQPSAIELHSMMQSLIVWCYLWEGQNNYCPYLPGRPPQLVFNWNRCPYQHSPLNDSLCSCSICQLNKQLTPYWQTFSAQGSFRMNEKLLQNVHMN